MEKRNVLFLLVDGLRADKCWGEEKTAKTPTIDLLSRRGTVFSQAIATTTTTTPSVSSIFTGLYTFQHGVRSHHGYKLNRQCTTMAEVFNKNGYHTYAEVSGPLLPEIGLDRGFDEYHCRDRKDNVYSQWGKALLNRFRSKGFKDPWFVFIHFWVLHHPRQILKDVDNKDFGKNKYERAISSLDKYLGQLLNQVEDDTVIIFHADHGERIFEREIERYYDRLHRLFQWFRKKIGLKTESTLKRIGHGFHVYEYLVRVPLIFVGEGIFPKGKLITDQVRQIDIFPTLVEALNLSGDLKVHGRSLMPLIRGEKLEELPTCCEACGVVLPDKTKWLRGIRTSLFKFVYAPYNKNFLEELYDLRNDPHEKKNIVMERPEAAQVLKKKLMEIYGESDEKEMLKEKISRLKAVGRI